MPMVFKGMNKIKSPGRFQWREVGCKGRAGGRPTFRGSVGCKGLRKSPREGGAWSRGRDVLGRWGGGLLTWGPQSPRELPCGVGTPPACRDWAGRGTVEAAPGELSETHGGRCREPWRRNLLVPVCDFKAGEGRGRAARADGGEPVGREGCELWEGAGGTGPSRHSPCVPDDRAALRCEGPSPRTAQVPAPLEESAGAGPPVPRQPPLTPVCACSEQPGNRGLGTREDCIHR